MIKSMIEFEDIGKCYGEVWVVCYVVFIVIEGVWVVLIGLSGCGKLMFF